MRAVLEGYAPKWEPVRQLGFDRQLAADLRLQLQFPFNRVLLLAGGRDERVPVAPLVVVDEVHPAAAREGSEGSTGPMGCEELGLGKFERARVAARAR